MRAHCVYLRIKDYQDIFNINWIDVQRKNFVNNVDMSSLRVPWPNGPNTHKKQNNLSTPSTPRRNRHSETNYFFLYLILFIILIWYRQEMLRYRLGTLYPQNKQHKCDLMALKMLGIYLYTLIIGYKSCNRLSILNKLTL